MANRSAFLLALSMLGCQQANTQGPTAAPPHVVHAKSELSETRRHSMNSKTKASMSFVNLTPKDLKLFWLDYKGQRKPYGTLPAGKATTVQTYLTHAWVVASQNGRGKAVFVADGVNSTVLINPMAAPKPLAKGMHSKAGAKTTLRFVNPTSKPVNLAWLDYKGQLQPRGQIPPHSELKQPTFAGNTWLVTSPGGTGQAVFTAKATTQAAVVSPEGDDFR